MISRRRMGDSELWCALGHIEAGQSITDVALFFGFRHSVISHSWKQLQSTQTVIRRPVARRSRVTTPAEDRYIAILINRSAASTRVTCMVTASIRKAISSAAVCRRLHEWTVPPDTSNFGFFYLSNQEEPIKLLLEICQLDCVRRGQCHVY